MSKRWEKITVIALIAALALTAGACSLPIGGKGQPATAAPTADATSDPVVTPAPTAQPAATATAPTQAPTAAPTAIPTVAPTAVPTAVPTAAPTAVPTAAPTPTPKPEKPVITKNPDPVAVNEGGSCVFEAGYGNAIWAVWHFVSPDGRTDLRYDQVGAQFPGMQVTNGMYSKMELANIPLSANGWKVYCRYTNGAGDSDTTMATLTVSAAAPVDLPVVGSYMDTVSQRASMDISGYPGAYTVLIHWGSSAWESTQWEFSGGFDNGGVMRFNNAVKYNVTFDGAGRESRSVIYTNGSGTLTYFPATGAIAWDDGHGSTGNFVRGEPAPTAAPVVNEWVETLDINAAINNSGVYFNPPIPEAVPNGLALNVYRSRSGIIEARYGGGSLVIRKSSSLSGTDLSGDYNAYSQEWDIVLKGLSVHCRGNGTTVNEATFSAGEYYSIVYNPGLEGQGLTPDQINSLVNGMS